MAPIKVIFFDFMGTCLDWHSSVIAALPDQLSDEQKSDFALDWRQRYFDANQARLAKGELPEDIDTTHRNVLSAILLERQDLKLLFTPKAIDNAIVAWHHQEAWPDVADATKGLRERGWEVFVHANGTTRLQLDLARSSALNFDMLFSSELFGVYKPAPESYRRALRLIKREPEECVMVAAHASDLRGAKAVGMKTVYVYRPTDDVRENQATVKDEFDVYLESMDGLEMVIEKAFGRN